MDDADNTEESAEDITAADTEPSPKKAEIKGQIINFFFTMGFGMSFHFQNVFFLNVFSFSKCERFHGKHGQC